MGPAGGDELGEPACGDEVQEGGRRDEVGIGHERGTRGGQVAHEAPHPNPGGPRSRPLREAPDPGPGASTPAARGSGERRSGDSIPCRSRGPGSATGPSPATGSTSASTSPALRERWSTGSRSASHPASKAAYSVPAIPVSFGAAGRGENHRGLAGHSLHTSCTLRPSGPGIPGHTHRSVRGATNFSSSRTSAKSPVGRGQGASVLRCQFGFIAGWPAKPRNDVPRLW